MDERQVVRVGRRRGSPVRSVVAAAVVLLGGCSLLNREGPEVTCEALEGGAVSACEDSVIARCADGVTVTYEVCDTKLIAGDDVCKASWQNPRNHFCTPGEMVSIPAGTFTMGDADYTEKAGTVFVGAFSIERTEVTTSAYAACVASGKCTQAVAGALCNAGVAGREKHPINCVDWYQAKAYCEAQGRRLPTEEEWEYAARGTDGRLFPWGDTAPTNQLCWDGDGDGNDLGKGNRTSTCVVDSYPSGNSPFGLADMSGNVWEWTSTPDGSYRVCRDGGWSSDDPSYVRSAHRYGYVPTGLFDFLGFRCAGSFRR